MSARAPRIARRGAGSSIARRRPDLGRDGITLRLRGLAPITRAMTRRTASGLLAPSRNQFQLTAGTDRIDLRWHIRRRVDVGRFVAVGDEAERMDAVE